MMLGPGIYDRLLTITAPIITGLPTLSLTLIGGTSKLRARNVIFFLL